MSSSSRLVRLTNSKALSWDDCRLLVESVVDYAICMLDPDGCVVTWNLGAERIKGYRADEIVGEHFSKFYVDEDVAAGKPQRELKTALDFGRSEDEGWRVRKDGSRFWASVVLTVLRDEKGQLRGFGTVTRDLTQRRAAEARARGAEERFHHLVDAVTEYAIFMLDETGHVSTWNAGAQRIKGYEPREILGHSFALFYTAEDRARGKPEKILDVVRREGRYEEEGWRVRKDGSRFWASVVISALRNEEGTLAGFAKVTRDLTSKRNAEEELQRSEERFRLLVEGVGDYAIYMLDTDGRVATWNLGAERMKGYTAAEVIGRSFATFFPEEDVHVGKPARELEAARAQGRFEDEGLRVRKDGTRFWANVVVTALRDRTGALVGFAKVTRDLTERRNAEEAERNLLREQTAREAAQANERRLRESEAAAQRAAAEAEQAAQRAEEASRVKDEFLATVSHELRTPLNAILGWASLLRGRFEDPSLAKGIDVIHRNAQSQAKLVEDILDVSRIVTGKLRLEVKPTSLVAVTREAIEVVRPSAAAKEITLDLFASNGTLVAGDAERLRQVIWNLLSNAIKFTPSGGRVSIRVEEDDGEVTVLVRDSGIGIEPDFLPYVFERFKQADSSTTRRVGGLGLGLAIVRHIVELHGGRVQAESAGKGQGALFGFSLPVRSAAALASDALDLGEPRLKVPSRPAAPLEGIRVLVVDDDTDARELLEGMLRVAGALVDTANSAAAGLQRIRHFRPNVLVSDIAMPDEDGYSFAHRVRELDPAEGGGIPSIALTAYTRAQDRTRALAAGFATHIGKPVDPDDLVAAVANLAPLGRRRR